MTTTGRVAGPDAQIGQQHVDVVGVLQVDPGVHQPVAGRERPQRHGLGRVSRPDDADGPGRLAGAQEVASGHEGPEDGVGQLGHVGTQAAELVGRDDQHPTGLADPGGEVGPLAGEHAELAQEAVGAVGDHHHLAVEVVAHDVDGTFDDHVEGDVAVPGPEQDVAHLDAAFGPVGRQGCQVGVGQGGRRRQRRSEVAAGVVGRCVGLGLGRTVGLGLAGNVGRRTLGHPHHPRAVRPDTTQEPGPSLRPARCAGRAPGAARPWPGHRPPRRQARIAPDARAARRR